MMYHKTTDELLNVLNERIAKHDAEITALMAVEINTKHKKLTNAAVTGGRIGDYIGINKALYVSYHYNHKTYNKYEQSTINAYSYQDEQGNEIGSSSGLRTSRTITPTELQAELSRLIKLRVSELGLLRHDARNAAKLVREYNALADKVNAFEDKLTWASRSVLKIG